MSVVYFAAPVVALFAALWGAVRDRRGGGVAGAAKDTPEVKT